MNGSEELQLSFNTYFDYTSKYISAALVSRSERRFLHHTAIDSGAFVPGGRRERANCVPQMFFTRRKVG